MILSSARPGRRAIRSRSATLRPRCGDRVGRWAPTMELASRDRNSKDSLAATALNQALAGFRVIDTTQVIAGPVAGRILADYGADVIKINDPRPDANPTGARCTSF